MPLCLSASSRSFYASSTVDRSRCRFCGLDKRVKDDFCQIYVQHNERYRASKGRAESRVEHQHGPSLQIRYYKQFMDSACAAPCKLGEVIIILMEKLRKQYFLTCNLVGVGVALTFRKKVGSIRQFFFGQSCDGGPVEIVVAGSSRGGHGITIRFTIVTSNCIES